MLTTVSSSQYSATLERINRDNFSPEAKQLFDIFQRLDAESCPYHYNFHMHTKCSDGQLTPEQLIEQAIAIGLKGFAITDHHNVGGYRAVRDWLQSRRWQASRPLNSPKLWCGVEITAELLEIEVHILGYGFDPEHPSIRSYLQGRSPKGSALKAANVIRALHDAGGIVVLAHPARYRRPTELVIQEAIRYGIDGVEAFYAYDNPSPWRSSPDQTRLVSKMAQEYNLLATCGTDTHGTNLLQRI